MVSKHTHLIDETSAGNRLDRFLADAHPDLTRTRIKKLIEEDCVQVDAVIRQPSFKLKEGMQVSLEIPELKEAAPQAQEVDFQIVFEDDDVIVINKPAGLVVHPGAGNPDNTLVNGLLAHCGDTLSGIGGVKRPGIVHRLDKGTSGLMVIAKNDQAHQALCAQFTDRSLKRTYIAICWGMPLPFEGTITGNIGRAPHHRQKMKVLQRGGKEAITHYEVLDKVGKYCALVECKLETGRTHQIRVHLTENGHSLVGDPLYGRQPRGLSADIRDTLKALTNEGTRPALHAIRLKFIHPTTGTLKKFNCPLPDDFEKLKAYLESL